MAASCPHRPVKDFQTNRAIKRRDHRRPKILLLISPQGWREPDPLLPTVAIKAAPDFPALAAPSGPHRRNEILSISARPAVASFRFAVAEVWFDAAFYQWPWRHPLWAELGGHAWATKQLPLSGERSCGGPTPVRVNAMKLETSLRQRSSKLLDEITR